MELLKQHGLFGSGLVAVGNPALVSRYNQCLVGIGGTPTALSQFQIDGRGWSPQVAEEKGDLNYLAHGGAVQFAIILTPSQADKPIYHPLYSFERALLVDLFAKSGNAIARITKDAGIWIQIGPGLSAIEDLSDLTMVRSVTVSISDTKGLIETALSQRSLVKRFVSEPSAWMDESLRQELAKSGTQHGDLRFPQAFKATYQFTETGCYYSPAFGGVFVFRDCPVGKTLIVVEKKNSKEETGLGCRICELQDRTLLSRLMGTNLVDIPLEWYRENPGALQELREAILVSIIYRDNQNGVDFLALTEAQREKITMLCRESLPPEFSQLERLEQRLLQGDSVSLERLPLPLRWLLVRPHESLSVTNAEVVWKLICRVAPLAVTTWYWHDKETFFSRYPEWPLARKTWTVRKILTSGLMPRRHV